jgi:hypothetical protein
MKSKSLVTSFFVAALFLFAIQAVAQQPEYSPNPDRMGQHQGTMAGMGPGMAGMSHNSVTMAEMSAMHELIVNHDRIERSVTNLLDGIRTVTESDDPRIAKLIKDHVASMDQRVSTKSDPGLPIESQALHSILRNGEKVQTTIETTEKGSIVIQTSTDPQTVASLQQHASEVSDLVKGGMAAMHSAMMKNNGGMMQGSMMHGHMMRAPNGEAAAPESQGQTPVAQSHDQHHANVNARGDQAMGFDHSKTTHHFLLKTDGGVIQVEANKPKDTQSRELIRNHLTHISHAFAAGDFSDPLAVHDKYPDGIPVMQRLKGEIRYTFEETPQGGRVLIKTANPQALDAIHQFLEFQIKDHQTGDGVIVN